MKETSIRICLPGERDIPEAIKLQETEHWNRTELDWHTTQLESRGCFGASVFLSDIFQGEEECWR
jgi:hypothetical protein